MNSNELVHSLAISRLKRVATKQRRRPAPQQLRAAMRARKFSVNRAQTATDNCHIILKHFFKTTLLLLILMLLIKSHCFVQTEDAVGADASQNQTMATINATTINESLAPAIADAHEADKPVRSNNLGKSSKFSSSFDRLFADNDIEDTDAVSSDDGFNSPTKSPSTLSELDYILSSLNPTTTTATSSSTSTSEASSTTPAESTVSVTTANSINTNQQQDDLRDFFDNSMPSTTVASILAPPEAINLSDQGDLVDSAENSLIRNRKSSPELGEQKRHNESSVGSYDRNSTRDTGEAKPGSEQPMADKFSDYDDFDLDYQLKLNLGNSSDSTNLNKRDYAEQRLPNWTALINKQSHLFTPASTFQIQQQAPQNASFQHPPIIPAVLTVKSTQLTSQELSRLRPHFLHQFYPDKDELALSQSSGNSSTLSQQQASYLANGDLLATASIGGSPMGPSAVIDFSLGNGTAFNSTQNPYYSQQQEQLMIGLINGSPVVRQPSLLNNPIFAKNATKPSGITTDQELTTIVVDNSAPTEAPPITISSSPSSTTALPVTSTTTSNPSEANSAAGQQRGGQSQANQWYNYPHPNLHHNPLLLHHIFNKPSLYNQHVGGSTGSAPVLVAQQTSSQPPLAKQDATTTMSSQNIIEKPTLNEMSTHQPLTLNKTQLQMQLNELKALDALKFQNQQLAALNIKNNIRATPGNYLYQSLPETHRPAINRYPFNQHLFGNIRQPNYVIQSPAFNQKLAPIYKQPMLQRDKFNQPFIKSPTVNLMSSPSLMQEVYTPKPVSSIPVGLRQNNNLGQPIIMTMMTSQSNQSPIQISLPAMASSTDGNKQFPVPDSGQNQTLNSMSEEDMSTYVAQLASFTTPNTEQKYPSPWPSQSQMLSSAENVQSPIIFGGGNINQLQTDRNLANSSPSAELQAAALLQQLKLDNSTSSSLINEIETIVYQKLAQDQKSSERQVNNVLELLKQAKLVGLTDDVQAKLYRDYIEPLLKQPQQVSPQPVPAASMRQVSPPYSVLHATALKSSPPTNVNLESWRKAPGLIKLASADNPIIKTYVKPLTSISNYYSSIDGHQKQQKKDKESTLAAAATKQQQQQQQRQLAFIEALRTSIMQLQASHESNPQTNHDSSSSELSANDFDEQPSANLSTADAQSQLSSKPIPDWLEKQIIQESFMHESARVNPFTQTASTKSIYINASPRPPAALLNFNMMRPKPAAILRPAGSHLYSTHLARPIYPLHSVVAPVPPLRQLVMSGSNLNHHYHHASYPSRPPPAMTSSLISTDSNVINQQQSYYQPVNPTKLLSDRFPLASAPAYLVKLPTLTGGTITASGSLIPPPIIANSHRLLFGGRNVDQSLSPPLSYPAAYQQHYASRPAPIVGQVSPLKLLANAAAVAASPIVGASRMKLIPSASISHALHQVPPHSSHSFHHPYGYHHHHHHHPASSWYPVSHLHHYNDHHLNRVPAYQPSTSSVTHYHLGADQSTIGNNNFETLNNQATENKQQQSSQASSVKSGGSEEYSTGNMVNSVGSNSEVPDGKINQLDPNQQSTLSRLQQATASLVELTGLASLVEEMVSGNDVESSPAIALANAINSISAAARTQNTLSLNAQPTTTTTTMSVSNQTENQQPYLQTSQQQHMSPLFSWKNLLNPAAWRDKSLLANKGRDLVTLERLMANALQSNQLRRPQTAKLRVKYIRVPVAVYETTGVGDNELGLNLITTNNPATGNLNGSTRGSIVAASPTSSTTTTSPSSSISATTSPSITATAIQPLPPTRDQQATTTPTSVDSQSLPNISSADYLFDELSSDSVPQIAFAQLRDHYKPALNQQHHFEQQTSTATDFLPIFTASQSQPLRPLKFKPKFTPNQFNDVNPLESALYYSILNNNQNQEAANKQPEAPSSINKPKKSRKKSKKIKDDDDDDEDNEDDDDILSKDDLPILESIISALVQHVAPPAAQSTPATSSGNWFKPTKSLFANNVLRGEASQNYETYANHPLLVASPSTHHLVSQASAPAATGTASSLVSNYLNPFSKYSHRFSLGEVVGALGARKLISTFLNKKRKINKITNKRAIGNNASSQMQSKSSALHPTTTTTTTTTTAVYDFMDDPQMINLPNTKSPQGSMSTLPLKSQQEMKKLTLPINHSRFTSSNSIKQPTNNNKVDTSKPVIGADKSQNLYGNRETSKSPYSIDNSTNSSRFNNSSHFNYSIPSMNIGDNDVVVVRMNNANDTNAALKVSNYTPDNVQLTFSQFKAENKKSGTESKSLSKNDLKEDVRSNDMKTAMPLYHIVADHYSKLHTNSNSLKKTISDQNSAAASRKANLNKPSATILTTVAPKTSKQPKDIHI